MGAAVGEFATIVATGFLSGAASAAAATWFMKRWMEAREASEKALAVKMETLSAQLTEMQMDGKECSLAFHQIFRTKSEAEACWRDCKAEQDNQWKHLGDHDRRLTRLETICDREHGSK